jgi:hypothetical protein
MVVEDSCSAFENDCLKTLMEGGGFTPALVPPKKTMRVQEDLNSQVGGIPNSLEGR